MKVVFGFAVALFSLAIGLLWSTPAQAQILAKTQEAAALQRSVAELTGKGKLSEAVFAAQRALSILEEVLPSRNPQISSALMVLADLHLRQNQLGAADAALNRALALRLKALPEPHPDVVDAKNLIATLRERQKKPDEAETLYWNIVEINERAYPKGNAATAATLANLARLYEHQRKIGDAISAIERAVRIFETVLPEWHPNLSKSLVHLASLYAHGGRSDEAELLLRRALAIRLAALPDGHPDIAEVQQSLLANYKRSGRSQEADDVVRQGRKQGSAEAYSARLEGLDKEIKQLTSLQVQQTRNQQWAEALTAARALLPLTRQRYGEGSAETASGLGLVATSLDMLGRHQEAEALWRSSEQISVKVRGVSDPLTLTVQAAFARSQGKLGHKSDDKQRLSDLTEQLEGKFGIDSIELWWPLQHLANAYKLSGDADKTFALHRRRIEIAKKAHGEVHQFVALALESLVTECAWFGRHKEAIQHSQEVRDIYAQLYGADSWQVTGPLRQLALSHIAQNRFADAEPHLKRILAITEQEFGPDSKPAVGAINFNAGRYEQEGRRRSQQRLINEAERLFSEAVQKSEKMDTFEFTSQVLSLASFYSNQRDWDRLLALTRRAAVRLTEHAQYNAATAEGEFGDRQRRRHMMGWLLHAAWQRGAQNKDQMEALVAEAFEAAQWAHSDSAAMALSQMSSRFARGAGKLADLIRRRQDATVDWHAQDKALVALLGEPGGGDKKEHEVVKERLSALEKTTRELDDEIAADFADYATLAQPKPLSLAETRSLLHDDEAIVFFSFVPPQSFAWLISKHGVYWSPLKVTLQELTERIAAIRCGLDAAAWDDPGGDPARSARCASRLGAEAAPQWGVRGQLIKHPRFDVGRSHQLYNLLLRGLPPQELLKTKHLLVVPTGPLTGLPFQVLITDSPSRETTYQDAAWLAKRHAVTVLPTIASLRALRQTAGTSSAKQPYIGFGNPLLHGPDGKDLSAWDRQTCTVSATVTQLAMRRARGRTSMEKLFRNGLANVEVVRAQDPLPETTDELCAVARSMGASEDAVYLGQNATESKVKKLSKDGVLVQARVLHFATHGLLASQTRSLATAKAEPALILSPPEQASEENDGLLTASEIAQLKLDADWVVLSACNTAAGESDAPNVEALSGLARAFFYAGARALLVSHWAVNSEATVGLIVRTFDELKGERRVGRAEALRRSMMALISAGEDSAHPANWAPFVVVGEGASK